jgi:hypothetical protein
MNRPRGMGFIVLLAALVAAFAATGASATAVAPEGRVADSSAQVGCAARCGDGLRGARRGAIGRGARARTALAIQNNPGVAVVINLRAIERVYRQQGRERELPGFYRDVLGRSGDPLVRNFINYRLARLELRGDDAKGALDALMRNLDENLQRTGTAAH